LGYVYDVTGRLEEAFENYNKAVELDPDDPKAQYNLGLAYYLKGNWQRSVDHYKKALDLEPEFSDAWHNLGIVQDKLGDKEEAVRCYDRAIETDPNNFQYYDARSRTLKDLGRMDEALADVDRSIELNPDYFESRMNRGHYYFLKGDYASSSKDYERASQLDPGNVMAWVMRAEIDRVIGNYIGAEKSLKRAHQLDPADPRPVYDLYRVYYALGKYHMALAYLDELEKMNPEIQSDRLHWKTLVNYNRGLVMERLGYPDAALEKYDQVIKEFPDYGESYTARGRIAYGKQDYKAAVEDISKGIELGTSDVDLALWYRASALYYQQQWQRALEDIKARSDQNDEELNALRKEIEEYVLTGFSGERKEYYDDGALRSVMLYKEGLPDGESRMFMPDGSLMVTMEMRNGKRNGKTVYYGPDGQTFEMMFEDDKPVGPGAGGEDPGCPFADKETSKAIGYNNQAYELFLKREHLQDGLDLIEQALAIDPGDPTFLSTKAELLYALGRHSEALECIQKALQKSSQHAAFQEDLQMIVEALE